MMSARQKMILVMLIAGFTTLSVPVGFAQEKVEGMVVALQIDRCGMKPGSCEGTIGIGEPGKARTLAVTGANTTIKKGGKAVVLQEVKLGDRAVAEVSRLDGREVAKVIEIHAGRSR